MGILRRLGHRIVLGPTILATVAWIFYLAMLRHPLMDWGLILAWQLLAAALGWWPLISTITAAALALALALVPGLADRQELLLELSAFWILGMGWGFLLRSFLRQESFSPEDIHPAPSAQAFQSRPVGRSILPSGPSAAPEPRPLFPEPPLAQPLPPVQRPAPPSRPPQAPQAAAPEIPTLPPLSQAAPSAVVPPPPPIASAPPLLTQEIDLGDFRRWAAERASSLQPEPSPSPSSPSSSAHSSRSDVPQSAASGSSLESAHLPETDPNSPDSDLVEWYNQFSAQPWSEEALRRRYPGGRWQEPALRSLQESLALRGTFDASAPKDAFDLEDVTCFLRCERLFELRRRGSPDLHVLSPARPFCDWLAAYQNLRSPARGAEGRPLDLSAQVIGADPARALTGRPSALLDVAGQSEVVALVAPAYPKEPMTWVPPLAAAHLAVASSFGVPLSGGLVAVLLPCWGETQPRLVVIEELVPEFRRLDAALERMRHILSGDLSPRAQSRPGLCNACGRRHACPNYLGQRPRLNLSAPPSFLPHRKP